MVIGTSWVIFWSVITNAMTGYTPLLESLVKLQNSSISTYANYTDIAKSSNLAFQHIDQYQNEPIYMQDGPNTTLWTELYQGKTFQNYEINKSLYTQIAYLQDKGFLVSDPSQKNKPSILSESMDFEYFYIFEDQYYNQSYFEDSANTICIQGNRYKWGFSGYIAVIVTFLNIVWCTGTYAVWVHMNRKSELCRKGRSLGRYRAVADLAEVMQTSLGREFCAYSDDELRQELEKLHGIKYSVFQQTNNTLPHIGLSSELDNKGFKLHFGTLYGSSGH